MSRVMWILVVKSSHVIFYNLLWFMQATYGAASDQRLEVGTVWPGSEAGK